MTEQTVIVWFRRDLRIEDNPALHAARQSGAAVIPVYILDDDQPHAPGAASLWWLHHSLTALAKNLTNAGATLVLRKGDAETEIKKIVEETGASGVFWNRRYHAKHLEIDKRAKKDLTKIGVLVKSFNGALLREPWELQTGAGGSYRVYTPFWKSLRRAGPAREQTLPRMRSIPGLQKPPRSDDLNHWDLTPSKPNWAKEIAAVWEPGEAGARKRLNSFLDEPIDRYMNGRDRPDRNYTSRLSPHLAFGEISPLQIWCAVHAKMEKSEINDADADKFLSELAWREFSYNLLFHFEALPEKPLRQEFESYPWRNDEEDFSAWSKGMTGYPIIDAGMRQLWRTGWMHNRVRMIVASFLIKDLLIPWQRGAAWFWETLVDADLANNSASWQWVAGCGADAAPYFRIFNPVTQGEKFDPDGDYVRDYVPELTNLSPKYIHSPWTTPPSVLQEAGVTLGKTYPNPIVIHAEARRRALEGYDIIKSA